MEPGSVSPSGSFSRAGAQYGSRSNSTTIVDTADSFSAYFKQEKHADHFALTKVIDVDASAEVVELFLDLINAPRLSVPTNDLFILRPLLKICRQYECSTVEAIRDRIGLTVPGAWELLKIASNLGDTRANSHQTVPVLDEEQEQTICGKLRVFLDTITTTTTRLATFADLRRVRQSIAGTSIGIPTGIANRLEGDSRRF